MSTNKLQLGETLTVTAPANKSSGDPVLIGAGIFGIAVDDALSGADMVIETKGMFTLKKDGATAFTAGDTAYYNNSSGLITATTTDLPVGKVYETCAGSGETTCKVILQPVMGTEAELAALQTALTEHMNDTTDAHDASAISLLDSGGLFTATEAEAAFAEVMTAVNDHKNDATDAHDASAISLLDSGGLFTATEAEAAFAELAGAGRTTSMTVKSAYDAATNNYTISWTGSNGAALVAPNVNTSGAVPAVGDIIELIFGTVTAGSTCAPLLTIGTDVAAALVDDGGIIKVSQLSASDLSGNGYYAFVRKV